MTSFIGGPVAAPLKTPVDQWTGPAALGITQNGEGPVFKGENGYAGIFMWGEFGGARIALKVSPDKKKWFDVADYAKTAEAALLGQRLPQAFFKWVVTGATGTTSVNGAVIY